MSHSGKMKVDVEIKAPVEKVYEFYTCIPHQMSKSSAEKIQCVELHEGQWGKEGSVYCWNYFLDEKAAKNKVIMTDMDYKNKSVTYKTMEGTLLKMFKSFKISLQVNPTKQGSLVRWTLEYEKLNANIPEPDSILQIITDSTKDVEEYLIQTQRSPQLHYNL